MSWSVTYVQLNRTVEEASALGVSDKALAPTKVYIDRHDEIIAVLDEIETHNHVAEAFESGSDLTEALKNEAEEQAIYTRGQAHPQTMNDLVEVAMSDLVDDPAPHRPLPRRAGRDQPQGTSRPEQDLRPVGQRRAQRRHRRRRSNPRRTQGLPGTRQAQADPQAGLPRPRPLHLRRPRHPHQ